jgi:biopolymer transport protein ExbD
MNFRRQIALQPAGFNITPLIDILLVLIIFFILTWNFSRDERDMAVRVPTATQAEESKPRPGEIILNVRNDGSVVLNQRTMDEASLKEVLKQVSKDFPNQPIIIRADRQVAYEHVIKVLDVCRAASIYNVAFATARERP